MLHQTNYTAISKLKPFKFQRFSENVVRKLLRSFAANLLFSKDIWTRSIFIPRTNQAWKSRYKNL